MYIAHLARAEDDLLAPPLEDKLRFVFREHVRRTVVLLRQLLLPLHYFAGKANDHVVLIGLAVNRDGTEPGAFDLHGLILGSWSQDKALTPVRQTNSLSCLQCHLDALVPRRSLDPSSAPSQF